MNYVVRVYNLKCCRTYGILHQYFHKCTRRQVVVDIADRFERDAATFLAPSSHQTTVIRHTSATHRYPVSLALDQKRPRTVDILAKAHHYAVVTRQVVGMHGLAGGRQIGWSRADDAPILTQ